MARPKTRTKTGPSTRSRNGHLKSAMPAKVLDSFALLAYFRDEPGADTMENLLVSAGKKDIPLLMTDVNYAEVKYSIVKKDGAEAWAEAAKVLQRSEERRVGKECRSRGSPYH